jgi:hypothetical protein
MCPGVERGLCHSDRSEMLECPISQDLNRHRKRPADVRQLIIYPRRD